VKGDVIVRELGRRERDAFVDVVATAFAQDPLLTGPLPVRREPRSRRQSIGTVRRRSDGPGSVARAPRGVDGPWRSGLAAASFVSLAVRLPLGTTSALNTYMRVAGRAAPTDPHHYLTMLGVAVDQRGAGHGRRLVEEVMDRARQHPRPTPFALDTENPANVAMYTNWEFRLTGVHEMSTLRIHAMTRVFRPRVRPCI